MRINKRSLQLHIANSGMTRTQIQKQGRISSGSMNRALYDQDYTPNLTTVGKIARVLGVSVNCIVEGDENGKS